MESKNEINEAFANTTENFSSKSKRSKKTWWNQDYHSQKVICGVIESFSFRAFIIFLVILDTALVIAEIILDSFKIHYECENKSHHSSKHHNDNVIKRLEIGMEIAHYASISILLLFVIELFVKIYAFGREFWNIRRKKMEYFDAFIVITSLAIDLATLRSEEKFLEKKLLLILCIRLWRFIRIISSVSEAILHGQTKHKQRLNKEYLTALQRLVELLAYKTTYIEENSEDFNSLLDRFHRIDDQCQSSLNILHGNHELTSSAMVAQFIEDLNGLENKNKTNIISAMFAKPSTVEISFLN